ncbi:PhaM family polyhydroxyalkanoate granule multifunctional regulatory protein [Rubrivivax rivuli]|uniref:Uncharacterized protein n=1 Tax=Rubrivivax rivuli TaxID=1862385 RepID=A0A437RSB2_9BURK|nr:PhaM family polyhydroxyalkanoate granule multifunctional regulatory protein [Rubrivivax rivuli]RVU49639.1 hypothetical protein EOE66_03530 [Rubrivivax rivuli]
MSTANDLARMVPGFEFLQNLMKGAGAALPGVQGFGQWVAPTLDPEELDKRIQELKTVQFWLEQNARLLGTTVQALEVQRMTLSTLKTMNLPMADLRAALSAKVPEPAAPAPAPAPPPAPAPAAEAAQTAAEPPAPAVDPMQWWGALTKQFADIASQALKEPAAAAPGTAAPAAKKAPRPRGSAAAAAPAGKKPAARKPAARQASPAPRRRAP